MGQQQNKVSEVLPEEFLQDIDYTYLPGENSFSDLAVLAEETLRTCEMVSKYLQILSEKADGGFEAVWYWRLLAQVRERLQPFLLPAP